jgi:hypothetical protein
MGHGIVRGVFGYNFGGQSMCSPDLVAGDVQINLWGTSGDGQHSTGRILVYVQVIRLLDASEHNALGEGSRNHIGVLLAIPKVECIALVRPKEYILSPFREATVVLHIHQCLAAQSAGVDEHARVGEHLVQLV